MKYICLVLSILAIIAGGILVGLRQLLLPFDSLALGIIGIFGGSITSGISLFSIIIKEED